MTVDGPAPPVSLPPRGCTTSACSPPVTVHPPPPYHYSHQGSLAPFRPHPLSSCTHMTPPSPSHLATAVVPQLSPPMCSSTVSACLYRSPPRAPIKGPPRAPTSPHWPSYTLLPRLSPIKSAPPSLPLSGELSPSLSSHIEGNLVSIESSSASLQTHSTTPPPLTTTRTSLVTPPPRRGAPPSHRGRPLQTATSKINPTTVLACPCSC